MRPSCKAPQLQGARCAGMAAPCQTSGNATDGPHLRFLASADGDRRVRAQFAEQPFIAGDGQHHLVTVEFLAMDRGT